MHSVILVDDDIAVLEFLRTMIPWESYRFKLTGTFTNAYDALEQCRSAMPDLIVTDIGMPGMDGIELIKAVKDISRLPRFVILSCHDEFRYAQQAVQMGVHDYILKETLDVQAIVDIASTISEKLEEEERLHFQAHRSKSALKEKWLRDLLTNPVSEDSLWIRQLEEFGLQPILPYFIPIVGRLHRSRDALIRYETEDTIKFIVENAVEELLANERDTLFFSYSAKEFCLLFNCRKELKSNPYDKLSALCKEVQHKLTKLLKLPVSMLIGDMECYRVGIKRQYTELIQDAERLFYSREPEFIKLNENNRVPNQDEDLLRHYTEYSEQMNRLIVEGNTDASMAVDPFIDFISSRKFSPEAVKQFVFKLVLDIMLKLKFNQQYTNEKLLKELGQLGNVQELHVWLIEFVKDAISLMEQISRQSKKVEIVNAKKYVQLHLGKKITLEEVADHLHLNPSYFSRLFKKETGENFIEYVKRLKMEKAKELLNDSDKTVDMIAQLLGYDNKGYFVKLFKQHFGTIPSIFIGIYERNEKK